MTLRRLFADPLLHVLLAGLAIYGVYALVQPEAVEADEILVTEDALVAFIGKRTAATDLAPAKDRLRALAPSERDLLVSDYVREQALLKEALRLGLDQDDYVMERRLVQRLEFTLQALAKGEVSATEKELRSFFESNRDLYQEPARMTFTHVYLNPQVRGQSLDAQAETLRRTLNETSVQFSEVGSLGDRFLYHRNYVDRPFDDIASHFGEAMAETLFAHSKPPPTAPVWSGPHRSEHGLHLVLVRSLEPARMPPFSEVQAQVKRDHAREYERNALEQAVQRIIDRYRVQIALQTHAEPPDPDMTTWEK